MIDRAALKPWELQKYVLPQHTDHAGVMWHGSYLNWLEEARVDALRQVGLPYRDLSAQGFEMPVVSLKINYIKALLHGQEVLLESRSLPRKFARWPWKTQFLSNGLLVAEADVDLVLVRRVGTEHRLIRNIPNQISNSLLKLQLGPR